MQLSGKQILITGAGQGIGAAIAHMAVTQGAKALILTDIAADRLAETVAICGTATVVCHPCVVDVADRVAVKDTLGPLCRQIGRIDGLVNNAGVSDENEPEDEAIWDRVIGINLNGTYNVTLAVLPYLAEGGRVVNIASILGRAGKVRNTAYSASKHGVLGFTKSLALDLAPRKITVNAILPGWVDTPMLRRELDRQASLIGVEPANLLRNARRNIPLRRLVETRETAELVGFLLSDAAAAITAQSLTIDGGFMCGA
ncbi:MAG: SDR family NAD(P)-dependent oxidoreductase [Gammaproteobacteria bacterium]